MTTLAQIPPDVQLIPPELDDLLALFLDDVPPDELDVPPRAPEPALPFAEWISCQASYFRSLGTGAGDWLADRLDADAATARLVRATSPGEFDEREGELIESHQARLRAEGYDAAAGDFGLPRW